MYTEEHMTVFAKQKYLRTSTDIIRMVLTNKCLGWCRNISRVFAFQNEQTFVVRAVSSKPLSNTFFQRTATRVHMGVRRNFFKVGATTSTFCLSHLCPGRGTRQSFCAGQFTFSLERLEYILTTCPCFDNLKFVTFHAIDFHESTDTLEQNWFLVFWFLPFLFH